MWQLFQQSVPFQDLERTLVCYTDEPHCLDMSDYKRTYALFPTRLHLPLKQIPYILHSFFEDRIILTTGECDLLVWSESVLLLLVWHVKDKVCSSNPHIEDNQKESIHNVVFKFLEFWYAMNCWICLTSLHWRKPSPALSLIRKEPNIHCNTLTQMYGSPLIAIRLQWSLQCQQMNKMVRM